MAPTPGGAAPLQNSTWSQLHSKTPEQKWDVWLDGCSQLQKRSISVWIAIVTPQLRPHLSSSLSHLLLPLFPLHSTAHGRPSTGGGVGGGLDGGVGGGVGGGLDGGRRGGRRRGWRWVATGDDG